MRNTRAYWESELRRMEDNMRRDGVDNHPEECDCFDCQYYEAWANALYDNPPCSYCEGHGCNACNGTGTR